MASYSQSLDLTAETATMTLTVGADITTYTYDNTTKLITFGARTSPMNLISLAELLLYVDAFRLWMGTLFKATNITVLGSRPAATMYWSDLKKWLVFVETFSLTCSEVM